MVLGRQLRDQGHNHSMNISNRYNYDPLNVNQYGPQQLQSNSFNSSDPTPEELNNTMPDSSWNPDSQPWDAPKVDGYNGAQPGGGGVSDQSNNSGNTDTSMNAAQSQMVGQGVGAAGAIVGSVVGGLMQNSENEKAENDSEQMYEMQRQRKLKQQSIDNSFKQKQIEQETGSMALKQAKENYDLRLNRWKQTLQNRQDFQNNINEHANKMADYMKNENVMKAFMNLSKNNSNSGNGNQ